MTPTDRAPARVHMLQLMSRTTGCLLMVGARPLTVLASDPVLAASELMDGRDPDRWQVRITHPL